MLVGLFNSLRVIVLGLILTTILGVIAIARLSDNWLVRQLALVYVEIFRNTPLLLQLFFWYFAVFLRLPDIENRITLPGPTYLTGRGAYLPGTSDRRDRSVGAVAGDWNCAYPQFGVGAHT